MKCVQIRLHLVFQRIITQGKFNVCLNESGLRSHIVAMALEIIRIHRLLFGESAQCIGQLDLSTFSGILRLQKRKDLRRS